MSHFTKVETKIKNLVMLQRVLDELGYEYELGSERVKVRGYRGELHDADLVIRTKSKYDIGVRRTTEGYEFVADWWGVQTSAGIEQEEFLQKVKQRYSYHEVMEEVKKQGYNVVEEETDEKQVVRIRVRKFEE